MLYKIVFNDNGVFEGGISLFETKWKEIPLNKKIRTIVYFLPTQDALLLTGFKRIYHYVEATQDLSGINKGKVNIEYSYLIIERNNQYIQYRINYKTNDIEVNYLSKDSHYIEKLNPHFWRG